MTSASPPFRTKSSYEPSEYLQQFPVSGVDGLFFIPNYLSAEDAQTVFQQVGDIRFVTPLLSHLGEY
jgi:hypothetical protein